MPKKGKDMVLLAEKALVEKRKGGEEDFKKKCCFGEELHRSP